MFQEKAIDWTVFGLSLAGLFLVCVFYALAVRMLSKEKLEGQTAWAVVIGVAITLTAMLPFFGLEIVAYILCYFVAAGIPMIIEYIDRVHREQVNDTEKARSLAREIIDNDDKQT